MISRVEVLVLSALAFVGLGHMFVLKVLSILVFPFDGTVGLFLLGLLGVDLLRRRRSLGLGLGRAFARWSLVSVAGVMLFVAGFRASFPLAEAFDLTRARWATDRALAEAAGTCPHDSGLHDDVINFRIDCGPPVRVAFDRGGGFIDNWAAIVYDPSGLLDGLGPPSAETSTGLRRLFGGDIVSCRRLEGAYFACSFT